MASITTTDAVRLGYTAKKQLSIGELELLSDQSHRDRRAVIRTDGHSTNLELPAEFNRRLLEFIATLR